MKPIEYLAGLFDGEGSFSIQIGLRAGNTMWANPSMSVNLYYGDEVLRHFIERFGGHIYSYQKAGVACGRRWNLGRREAVLVAARALEPHLEIKKDIARRFIQALLLFPAPRNGPSRREGGRVWGLERSIAVAEIALTLNPARSRKSNKTAEYLEILRAGLDGKPEYQTGAHYGR